MSTDALLANVHDELVAQARYHPTRPHRYFIECGNKDHRAAVAWDATVWSAWAPEDLPDEVVARVREMALAHVYDVLATMLPSYNPPKDHIFFNIKFEETLRSAPPALRRVSTKGPAALAAVEEKKAPAGVRSACACSALCAYDYPDSDRPH